MVIHNSRPLVGGSSPVRPSDRRDSYRFDVRDAARLRLPESVQLPVADLSASGMALHLPRHHLQSLDSGRAVFQLGADLVFEASFDTVSTSAAGTGGYRVGTRFRHLSRSDLQKLSEFLLGELMSRSSMSAARPIARESSLASEDSAFLAALLCFHGIKMRRPVRTYVGERAVANQLAITEVVEGDRIQLASLLPLPADFRVGSELSFLMSTAGSALWFQAVVRCVEPHRVEIAFPARIVRSGFRDSFRADVDRSDLKVRFRHPRLPVVVSKGALDVSARGLSFPLDVRKDILFPGDHLAPLQIMLPQGPIHATAIVRSVRELDSGGMGCGVELLEVGDPIRWAAAVFRNGHPNTLLSEDDAPAGAWQALDTSGYLDMWTHPSAWASAKRDFQLVWQSMPKSHGLIAVVKRSDRAVSTFAASRVYRRTWMMHQLGVDKRARRPDDRASFYSIIRELYSGLLFALQHLTDLKYMVGYFGTDSRWCEPIHLVFERAYPVRSHLASSQYGIYRTSEDNAAGLAPAKDSGYHVRPIAAPDVDEVVSALARRFTPMECDAYDYEAGPLLNDDLGRECTAAGYARSRRNYVIEDAQSRIVGLLMLEMGAEGANLFNLLNTCRFIPLRGLGRDADLVRGLALDFAKRRYARAGKRSHLFFDYGQQRGAPSDHVGYRYLYDGLAWLIHRDALPAWLSHIDDLLGIKSDRSRRSGAETTA